MKRLAFALAFSTIALACSAVKTSVSAPDDYASYRRWRLAEKNDARLQAAAEYLHDEPHGAFHAEVMRWFGEAEARFYATEGHTPIGAAKYLKLMPDGPHAKEEGIYLAAWEKEEREAPLRAKKALEEARAKADAAKKALGVAIESYTKHALAITSWGDDVARVKETAPEFAKEFFADPAPACNDEQCLKLLYFTYAVPDADPAANRVVPLVVGLDLTQGKLGAVLIVAPKGGFTWWMEGAEGREIDPFDVKTREEALARAKNRIETIARATLKDCVTAEASSIRTISCGSTLLKIEAAPNGDDVVRIVGGAVAP